MNLREKISNKSAKIGVIGLGYVGLPLSFEYAQAGFHVIGIDNDMKKINALREGENYIDDVDSDKLKKLLLAGKIEAESDYSRIAEVDVIFICVPTPFTINKEPDVSYIRDAGEGILNGLRKEHLVILKSTTYPETTEKLLLPVLQQSGLRVGEDFYLAFSPERIDPGNKTYTTANTPVVVGGVTKQCTEMAVAVSELVISKVVPLSNTKAAEMTKLLENIFRSVNIALVNELAQLCDRMEGVDMWEVVDAAATKPFGFMPFYPGPGIGGHCILVDPYYLAWKAKEYDFHSNFIQMAGQTNENMPYYVLDLIIRSLSIRGGAILASKFLMLGVSFKKNVDDVRNSPALKLMELLHARGGKNLTINDPYVPEVYVNNKTYKSRELTKDLLENVDCVVIATAHDKYDIDFIATHAKLVVDTRNATKSIRAELQNKIVRLGHGSNTYHPTVDEH